MNADILVKDIMSTDLVNVSPEAPFEEVKAIFENHDFHHIPVLNFDGSLVGLISKTDWLMSFKNAAVQTGGKTWTQKFFAALKAKDIMTRNPVTLELYDSVELAADIFFANKFHALPIVEDGVIQGILTPYDLVNYAFCKAPLMK